MATTIETLQRFIEHAPADPGPLPPGLLGWNVSHRSPFDGVFVCSHCAGRIMARGCRLPGDHSPVWKDGKPAGPCCCCKPPQAAEPPPVSVNEEQIARIIGAAVALFQKTDRVNNGIWQVPHAAMRNLVAELTAAGVSI